MPNYHEWMQDPQLLEATASEPLTMEQEIEMQQEWRDDEKKCTFIILARDLIHRAESGGDEVDVPPPPTSPLSDDPAVEDNTEENETDNHQRGEQEQAVHPPRLLHHFQHHQSNHAPI